MEFINISKNPLKSKTRSQVDFLEFSQDRYTTCVFQVMLTHTINTSTNLMTSEMHPQRQYP